MATIDKEFAELCAKILKEGKEYENKNRGVKRLQIPSYNFRHEFKDGFPALTGKKLYWRSVVGELLWFLRGDTDIKYLNDNGIKIWNKDAYNWYAKHNSNNDPVTEAYEHLYHENEDGSYRMFTFEEFEKIGTGDVGRNYSAQWRDYNYQVDQIEELIKGMKEDIMSSRLIVTAWNPSELNKTALPSCHNFFQVIGVPLENDKFGFELHFNMRSWDVFLGAPFNIASYGLLAKILEDITGYEALAIEASAKCVHFYDNQYEAAKELLTRDVDKHPNCELKITNFSSWVADDIDLAINLYQISDFELVGYTCDEAIKVEMLAPKKLD